MLFNWRQPAGALFLSLLCWLIASPAALATIRVVEVLGASHVEGLEPDETGQIPANITIYAGVAGTETLGACGTEAKDGLNPCNNCSTDAQDWGKPCNQRRVYPDLQLRITFVNEGEAGRVRLTGTTVEGSEILNVVRNPLDLASGETGTISVLWTDICGFSETEGGGDATCSTDRTNFSLRLGVDRDNSGWLDGSEYKLLQIRIVRTIGQDASGDSFAEDCSNGEVSNSLGGLCYFEVYPGDKKVYISRYIGPSSLPTNFTSIKIFCSSVPNVNFHESHFDEIRPSDICASIQLAATTSDQPDAELIDGLVNGLTNDQGYYFRAGSADKAGNIGYFTKADHDTTCAGDTGFEECRFAVPAKVEGLLSDDLNCFIATAAFGSPLDPKVADFREFRNKVLLPTAVGRAFVRLYYELSPPLAHTIATHPALRKVTQMTLWPLWALSQVYLFSPLAMIALLILIIALPIFVIKRSSFRKEWIAVLVLVAVGLPAEAQNHPNEPPYTSAPEPGFEGSPMAGQSQVRAEAAARATSRGFAIKGGAFRPTEITNESTGVTFSDIYGEREGPIIFLDYDLLLAKPLGRLNFKIGTGVYASKPGRGRFVSDAPTNQNLESMEKFTYIIFPNTVTFQYKLQYSPTQWIVPYGEGGGGYFAFMEVRDDKFSPKLGGAPVAVAGGGVQFLLDYIDKYSMAQLRADHNIQHVWLVVDFKRIQGLHDKYDFTSNIINGGFYLEF